MKIEVKESTMVRPAEATPAMCLWISNLDLLMPTYYHMHTVYLYRCSDATSNFFDPTVLKAALARAMVHFYPVAGRLKMTDNNGIEIDCNGEGALFIEAESDGLIDDLVTDYEPRPDDKLTPTVDCSKEISTCPILLVQVTRFRCGGVCLGVALDHHVADGISALHFINSWSEIARGLDISVPPFLDRRAVLSAHNPPQPKFEHIECQSPPSMKLPQGNCTDNEIVYKKFKLTCDQMNALKEKCKEDGPSVRYSTYEVLAGHLWCSISIARGLPADQETRLGMPVDGRNRLRPTLPQGYFGNVIYYTALTASAGELQSNPVKFVVSRIHHAIARTDDEYLRSAMDYLDLQPDLISLSRIAAMFKCPNLRVVSWARLPFYEADFGWGRPVYVGIAMIPTEGICYVLATNDGSILCGIALPRDQVEAFEKYLNRVDY